MKRRLLGLCLLLGATAPAFAQQSVEAGDYRVLYAAINSEQLTAPIARTYGVLRARDTALVTFTVQRRDGPVYKATAASGTASVRTLIGHRRALELRKVREQDVETLVADLHFDDGEFLIIDAQILPRGSSTPIAVSFKQQFYRD